MNEEKQFVLVLKDVDINRILNSLQFWIQNLEYDDGTLEKQYQSIISTLESQVKHQRDMGAATCRELTS